MKSRGRHGAVDRPTISTGPRKRDRQNAPFFVCSVPLASFAVRADEDLLEAGGNKRPSQMFGKGPHRAGLDDLPEAGGFA